jgi:hypothetical protein
VLEFASLSDVPDMLIDSTLRQQPLPGIKALFGIAQSGKSHLHVSTPSHPSPDRLSAIETISAPDQRLQPPRAALTQFSLSELRGSLPAPVSASPCRLTCSDTFQHAPLGIPAPAWMLSTPESHARKPHTPSSARTTSAASVRTPSSALASPAHVSLATHYARNGHLDPGAVHHSRTRSFSDASDPVHDFRESSKAERQEYHAYPPPPAPAFALASHPVELGRRNTVAIGARPSASPNEAASRLHHRRVSSGSSVSSSNRRSRSPLAQLIHPPSSRDIHPPAAASSVQKTPESVRRVPGETGFGGEHVLMRVQHGEGFEFTKEFLAAKYECQYCGKRFNRPSSLKVSHLLSVLAAWSLNAASHRFT